ncbi:hypothetical protein EOPP23_15395 [Endozoicomonas sp. OPT23]|uniref:hypothetical protein n=1 Tax=Endozoicomonas sp. OPT23 TaxID=2072845 RepID=UPI00129B4368|nr:hypothetical protein [Endozoicomonas sp. OPT23]MRI34373.1 hypothetical protein [Endozoicomonas sp. OPT23]
MRITMVKKELADGSPCKKCREVQERLDKAGQMQFIDKVVVAKESDPTSEGSLLADFYNADKAPFFIVEEEGQETRIFTIYFKLVKEVFNALPA